MAKLKFKDENNDFIPVVQDVKINGSSTFDGKDANINLKTINNNSIIGEGNINIDTSSTYAELPDKPSINNTTLTGNKTSSELGLADDNDITNLQTQIDAITVSSDVVDVLGTYQDLQNYDTSKLTDDDIVKVLQDSTHSNAMSYFRWTVTNDVGAWAYVGSEGPFYTKSESDTLLNAKANTSDLATIATSGSYEDLVDNPHVPLDFEGSSITLTNLFEDAGDVISYEVVGEGQLEIDTSDDTIQLDMYMGDLISLNPNANCAVIFCTSGQYYFDFVSDVWLGGYLTTKYELDTAISQAMGSYVTTNTEQNITAKKSFVNADGIEFRVAPNSGGTTTIRPTSTSLDIYYQANNRFQITSTANKSCQHLVPYTSNSSSQMLGTTDNIWYKANVQRLNDGTMAGDVLVNDIASKTDVANTYQPKLTAGTGIAITNNVISSTLEGIDYEVDQELPATGEKGIIYLIPNQSSEEDNIYDEYIWIPPLQEGDEGRFEFIGTTQTDLTNYVTTNTSQEITGTKTFKNDIILGKSTSPYFWKISKTNSLGNHSGSINFEVLNSTAGTSQNYYYFNDEKFAPASGVNNTIDLGGSNTKWKDLYLAGKLTDGTNQTSVGNINNNFAPIYDATSAYAVGDRVIYEGRLYKCTTAITTAEAWDSTHWIDISVSGNYVDLDTAQTISATKTFTAEQEMPSINLIDTTGLNSAVVKLKRVQGQRFLRVMFGDVNTFQFDNYGHTSYASLSSGNASSTLGTMTQKWPKAFITQLADGNNSTYGLILPDTTSYTANKTLATTDDITTAVGDINTALTGLVSGGGVQ